jgi:uncharacterized membrane protein (UPF0127 family)
MNILVLATALCLTQATQLEPVLAMQNRSDDVPARVFQLRELDTTTIKVAGKSFTAWVMDTDAKRSEGMMHLELRHVKDNQCMIFVFKSAEPRSFWMANCKFDLDILYLSAQKQVVRATTMKAWDRNGVPSNGAAKYAIEFKPGTIRKYGFKKGMTVTIPNDVQSID